MNRTHSLTTKSLAIGVALAATVTLSGCFANPLDQITEGIAKGGAEKLVEGMTGSDVELGSGELPKDFPAEVPLVDGEIVSAIKLGIDGGSSWSVTLDVDDVSASLEQAREQLLGAGFEETMWNNAQGMGTGMFSNDEYGIILGGIDDGDESILTFQVITAAAE